MRAAEARAAGEAPEADSSASGQTQLAALLYEADAWASYPLTFVVTHDVIEQVAADHAAGRPLSNRHGAAALVASARLCALDMASLVQQPASDDGDASAAADDGGSIDPNEMLEDAVRRLAGGGRWSAENDAKAAELLREAARDGLEALRNTEVSAADMEESTAIRPACARLVDQVRASEAHVLERLAHGGGVEELVGLSS